MSAGAASSALIAIGGNALVLEGEVGSLTRQRERAAEFGEQDYSGSVGSSFFDGRLGARLSVRSYEDGGEYIYSSFRWEFKHIK